VIDRDWEVLIHLGSKDSPASDNSTNLVACPSSLAYVIYTSGSTGRPKGVMLEHHSIVNYIYWHIRYYEMTSKDRVFASAGLAFDASMADTWPTLAVGATLLPVMDPDIRVVPSRFLNWVSNTKASMGFLTTQICEMVLEEEEAVPRTDLGHLRLLFTGGDRLHYGQRLGAQYKLVNIYGPTENTVNATMTYVTPGTKTPPLIGAPAPNTLCYVLRPETMTPVPVGVYGELFLGGVQLARGYFKSESLTKESFIHSPFKECERLYKTGDVARWLDNGQLEFLGRRDTQVKIRGNRVELTSIESKILEMVGIKDVVVVAREDVPGMKRLVAYVVPCSMDLDVDSLRKLLVRDLPSFMVPGAFVLMNALPLTANQKIDRRSLPAPVDIASETAGPIVQSYISRSLKSNEDEDHPLQRQIRKVFIQVLGLKSNADNDVHFFDAGGDSLSAGRVTAKTSSIVGYEIPVSLLYSFPTLSKYTNAVAVVQGTFVANEDIIYAEYNVSASLNEQSLWLVSQGSEAASAAYNIPFGCKMSNGAFFEKERFKKAIDKLVDDNEELRARYFSSSDGDSFVERKVGLKGQEVDLEWHYEWNKDVREYFTVETYKPFDFEKLLIRFRVLECNDGCQYLLVVLHHIITDLWSMVLFVQELFHNYYSNEDNVVDCTYSYFNFIQDQQRQIESPSGVEAVAYWTNKIKSFYNQEERLLIELPWTKSRPASKSFRGTAVHFRVGLETSALITQMSTRHGFTMNVVLLSIFNLLLRNYSGHNHLGVGMPTSGRVSEKSERVMGYFVNPLVVFSDLSGNPTFEQLLERVSKAVLDALDHQGAPYPLVAQKLQADGVHSSGGENSLFNVAFVFQKAYQEIPGLVETLLGFDDVKLELHPEMKNVYSFVPEHRHSQFDVTMMIGFEKQQILGSLHINTDVLDRKTGEKLVEHFVQLLDRVARCEPESQRLSEIKMLTEDEFHHIVTGFNATYSDISDVEEFCIHHLVEKQCQLHPDKICIEYIDEDSKQRVTLTYGELDKRSNCLCNFLRFSGVKLDVFVPVMLKRGVELVVAWLAVLKAGGAIMPLDPKYPLERVKVMIEDAVKYPIAVTSSEFKRIFKDISIRCIALDVDWDRAISLASSIPLRLKYNQSPQSLAYIIYTSGSTGKPKGVLLEHRSIVNYVAWHIKFYGMNSADRVFACAGLAFDASMADTWPTLIVGATLLPVMNLDTSIVAPRLLDWIAHEKATMGFLTTQVCEMVLEEDWKHPRGNLERLRVVYTGGDRLHFGTRLGAPYKLVNIYGPTECTVNVTMKYVEPGTRLPPSIGSPAPNICCFILDPEFLHPLPVGVFGELFVSGIQVGRGYLNLETLTAERFVDNPFVSIIGEKRMYRTGDLCRWNSSGEIEFLGRRDNQVKIRGNRVECSAIETVLMTHSQVKDAIVVAEQGVQEKILIGYVVCETDIPSKELLIYLKQQLPGFMVPSVLFKVDKFPMTINHKVDRNMLRQIRLSVTSVVAKPTAVVKRTMSKTDTEIVKIFAAALGKPEDDILFSEDFFEQGGHSLAAARIISQVRSVFGIDVSLSKFLQRPCAKYLSELVLQEQQVTVVNEQPSVGGSLIAGSLRESAISGWLQTNPDQPSPVRPSFISSSYLRSNLRKLRDDSNSISSSLYSPHSPMLVSHLGARKSGLKIQANRPLGNSVLSYNQQSLWFLHKMNPMRVDFVVHVAGVIDNSEVFQASLFQHALQLVVDQHESLRTTYGEENGIPFQRVYPIKSPISLLDFQLVEFDDPKMLKQFMMQLLHEPWDLQTHAPIKVRVCRHRDSYSFIITAHHIALDGWSLDILLEDVGRYYSRSSDKSLDEGGLTMSEFAKLQKEDMNSSAGNRLWNYWQRQLAGHDPVLDLPTDRERSSCNNETLQGQWEHFDIPDDFISQIQVIVKLERATLFCALLALYAALLSKYSGKEDILIGTPMACRTVASLDRTVGNIANIVVLRMNVGKQDTFRTLLRQARSVVLGAFEHQEFPFPILVEKLCSFRDASRSPLFQVLLSLNQAFRTDDGEPSNAMLDSGLSIDLGPLKVSKVPDLEQLTSPYDLQLIFNQTTSSDGVTKLKGSFQYKTCLFNQSTIKDMVNHFISLVSTSGSDFNSCYSKMSMLSEEETDEMVGAWNDTYHPFDETVCIHQLFEEQVRKAPFAVALGWDTFCWSYNELNCRANILARYLRVHCKVKPNTKVGVLLERSPLMVLAMLAISKSGATYVPMDTCWPPERLSYVFEDSQMLVVFAAKQLKNLATGPRVLYLERMWTYLIKSEYDDSSNIEDDLPPPSSDSWGANEDQWKGSLSNVYMIYTSGSTGTPKGVSIEHRSLVNLVQWHQTEYEVTRADRASQLIGAAFDPVGLEIWPFLSSGASIHFTPDDIRSNIRMLHKWLDVKRISVCLLPTPLLEMFLKSNNTGTWPNKLRVLYGGGDKLHVPSALLPTLPFRLDNHYGPSETSIMCTCFTCGVEDGVTQEVWSPWIGKPIANYQTYILDEHLQPVPKRVSGELYIGGVGVSPGYHNRDELNRDKFIQLPDHLAKHIRNPRQEMMRLYKTGDSAQFRRDGNIDFVGRMDFQVKIRGMRIELGEIESVIKQSPMVLEACVVAREDVPGQKRLSAYIVPSVEMSPMEMIHQLRSLVKDKLPEYMMPFSWMLLERLPQTSNGKIDRKHLPVPNSATEISTTKAANTIVLPRSVDETVLAEIWHQVLGLQQMSIHDNFFDLGGHSLAATQLLSKVQDTFHVDVTISQFFFAPTIAGMTNQIVALRDSSANELCEHSLLEFDPVVECRLDEAIGYDNTNIEVPSEAWITAFITGATGFLGSFLVQHLLAIPGKSLICLVRGTSVAAAKNRLTKQLAEFEIFDEDSMPEILSFVDDYRNEVCANKHIGCQDDSNIKSTIFLVSGDLEMPLLGLTIDVFSSLAECIDVIVHAGAFVHSVYPYSRMRLANVEGTKEVIRLAFARQSRRIFFLYISTLSVFASSNTSETFKENGELTSPENLHLLEGYAQTKWVAEHLVKEAQRRGLPGCILRPGRITGDSVSGNAQYTDFMAIFIKGCIQLQAAPNLNWPMDINPVDKVCDVILNILQSIMRHNGQAFNMRCENPVLFDDYISWVNSVGYECNMMEYTEWRAKLIKEIKSSSKFGNLERGHNALYSVLPMFAPMKAQMDMNPGISFESSISNRIEDLDALNQLYLKKMIQREFLPPPTKSEEIFPID